MNSEKGKQLLQNMMGVEEIKVGIMCVELCKTVDKDYLEVDDKLCLINCGYNWHYLQNKFIELQKSLL